MSQLEFDGWKSVVVMAESKHDENLLTRIRGVDLFACEAKFHKNCRMNYVQKSEKWRSTDDDACAEQISLMEAHRNAFKAVCLVVENEILIRHKMMKLVDLRHIYITSLEID